MLLDQVVLQHYIVFAACPDMYEIM